PSRIGAMAAIGALELDVYARPRIAILSTGNEIVEPGTPLGPGQIYDINKFTLSSIITAHGGEPVVLPTALDSLDALSHAIDAALAEDVLVFSGGSSVGERDLILDVLVRRGEVLFHGVAVKPGKPTVFGRVAGKPVLGMPGYPTSCLSNGYMLLVPMLRRMARLPEHRPEIARVPLARRIVSTTGRHQFFTVRIADGIATPAFKASGDITSMSRAVRPYIEGTGLPFDILIDERRDVLSAYGVWHRVGLDAWNIARPAVFLIDTDRRIRYSFIADQQRQFPPQEEILAAIDAR